MTRRERKEARRERRESWAQGRDTRAEQAHNASRDAVAQMPLGEPIHPGAKGRRQRSAIDRSRRQASKAVEHSRMAERHRSVAANIGGQLDRSVFSDDADAVERLRARIAEREAERGAIKAFNRSCKKGEPAESLLTDSLKAELARCRAAGPGFVGAGGSFPAFVLRNLSGKIAADRKRLAELEGQR